MNNQVQTSDSKKWGQRIGLCLRGGFASLLFCAALALTAMGQSPKATKPAPAGAGKPGATSVEAELQRRVALVEAAKQAQDPAGVARASEAVIALGLRILGQIRLLEASPQQALELYTKAAQLEASPETRLEMAVAALSADQVDRAITEAQLLITEQPGNAQAYYTLGRALTAKGENLKAAEALHRSVELSPDLEALYYEGIAYLSTHEPKYHARAAEAFQQMVKMAGDTGSLHVLFGRAYRDADDLESAIRELKIAVKLDTKTPHAHYFLGLATMAQNEWVASPEAQAEFRKELGYYPKDYLANYLLGLVKSQERRFDESDRYLKVASEVNPSAPGPWLYLGINAFARDDKTNAETYFRKAIDATGKDDEQSNFQIRRAYTDLGRILVSTGRKEEAEPYLSKARDLQNRLLATSRAGMAERFGEAQARSLGAVEAPSLDKERREAPLMAGPVDPFAHVDQASLAKSNLTAEQRERADAQEKQVRVVLGQGYADLATSQALRREYAQALANYQEAERWDAERSGLKRSLGIAAYRAQNYDEAIRGLADALKENPQDKPVRAMLGSAYFAKDKNREAVNAFEPLGERGKRDSSVGYAWAASLARLGELQPASEVLQEFQAEVKQAPTLLLVGQLWIEIGDYARAVASLEQALAIEPGISRAHYFMGQANLRSEKWAEAKREFQAELDAHPSDVDARYNLGFVDLQLGETAEAERLFREVLVAEPNHPNSRYELGKMLLERGEIKQAIGNLEVAAHERPKSDYIHYQLQAAYRKDGRTADADREMEIYKALKAQQRQQASDAIGKIN